MRRYVSCCAEGRDSRWEAFCVDFDLAVQGSNFDEVRQKLHDQILLYLETVAAQPVAERARLLERRAPLLRRIELAARVLTAILRASQDTSRAKYDEPVDAALAAA